MTARGSWSPGPEADTVTGEVWDDGTPTPYSRVRGARTRE